MRTELGTKESFESFLIDQVTVYKMLLKEHYGLPDPETYKSPWCTVVSPTKPILPFIKENEIPKSVSIDTLHFVIEYFQINEQRIKIWVKQ